MDGGQKSNVGEIIEQHPTSVDKRDFRKSHTYTNPSSKGSNMALGGQNLKINMQLMSNRIDECS